jgi:hypothetical protein
MKTKKIYFISGITLLVLLCTTACNKYLDVKPSKGTSVVIQSTSDLNALLENFSIFYLESDNVVVNGTDDNDLPVAVFNARPSLFTIPTIEFTLWDKTDLPNTDVSSFSGPNFWSNEYTKIFDANLVLLYADKVTGSDQDKANLKADAYFIRAYSYWQLANAYCLPYTDANKNEPGLPMKTTPDYDVPARSSLAATYQQIESDLTEALKTTVPLVQNGIARHWRANTAAVNGFAARYWLNRNDYAKALTYANASLAEYSTLVDYNTAMSFGTSSSVGIDPGTPNAKTVVLQFPYTHNRNTSQDPTDALAWKEFLYYRLLNDTKLWFIPSQSLLNLYDQNNDLRYKYHYVQGYSYKKGLTSPSYSYPGYVFFYEDKMPEGPTVAEMILIKAECLARTNDISGSMTALNLLRSKRMVTGTPPVTAASQDQAILTVLQERRREIPFAQRWNDIRRFNNNGYANDDIATVNRTFYPYTPSAVQSTQPTQAYTLPANSRRFASPLPQTDISNSNGILIQNTY